MDKWEKGAKYNVAETCSDPVSIDELREISEDKSSPLDLSTKMTYGAIRGSDRLRGTLANLYSVKTPTALPADNVLITLGAIQANFLLLYSLVGPGDHVICHYPTYQQLYSVPESVGAEVSLWKSKEADGWTLDIDELKGLIRPNTKLIIIKYVLLFSYTMSRNNRTQTNIGLPHQQPSKSDGGYCPSVDPRGNRGYCSREIHHCPF